MIEITQKIKKACIHTLWLPLGISILCIALFFSLPFIDIFHPQKIKNVNEIKNDTKYIQMTADSLCYSGYDLVSIAGKKYGYYYQLKNDHCTFFLIPVSETPKHVIKNYTFNAKVISQDSDFTEMAESFAKDLAWDRDSMLHVTRPFIVSGEAYHPVFYLFVFWLILVILLINLKKILQAIIGFVSPDFYPVCSFLGRKLQREIINEAQEELTTGMFIQINSMYITENYFIDFGKSSVKVIPLRDIIWCYRLGNIPLNPLNQTHNFSVNFMIRSGKMISISHKTSDEALELVNAIRATEYDIIIGHSDAKKKQAKQKIE